MPLVSGIVSRMYWFVVDPRTQIPLFHILVTLENLYNGLAIVSGYLGPSLGLGVVVTQELTVLFGVNYKTHILLLESLVKGGRL
jgi:hypothetical protein